MISFSTDLEIHIVVTKTRAHIDGFSNHGRARNSERNIFSVRPGADYRLADRVTNSFFVVNALLNNSIGRQSYRCVGFDLIAFPLATQLQHFDGR